MTPSARKAGPPESPTPRRGAGRPAVYASPEDRPIKTTVGLQRAHRRWLDRLALDLRDRHDVIVDRSQLIAALVGAVAESGVDLTSATSADGIREAVLAKLKR